MVRQEFPDVRLLVNEENLGFAAANNQAIQLSGSRYVLLLNPDTEVTSSSIRGLISFLETHPAAGIVGPRLRGRDGGPQVSAWRFPSIRNSVISWSHLSRVTPAAFLKLVGYQSPEYPSADEPRQVDWVSGACMLVRREVIEQIGMLDERFFMYAEETDFCKRAQQAGWAVWQNPRVEVIHQMGASSAADAASSPLQMTRYHRSECLYFAKHHGRLAAVTMWAVRLIFSSLSWLRWSVSAWWLRDADHRRRQIRHRLSLSALWRVARAPRGPS